MEFTSCTREISIFLSKKTRLLLCKGINPNIHLSLDSHVLHLIDNAQGHLQNLQQEKVQIVFLPKNTTTLLQPLGPNKG